jgi:hypothetical protein
MHIKPPEKAVILKKYAEVRGLSMTTLDSFVASFTENKRAAGFLDLRKNSAVAEWKCVCCRF